MVWRQPLVDANRVLLLRFLRAASQEHNVLIAQAYKVSQLARPCIVAIRLRAVELERTGVIDCIGMAAELTKSRRRLLILRRDNIYLAQHIANHHPQAAIA